MLLKATASVSGLTLTSRVFGFIRDVLLAKFVGAGPASDAFFVALRLPNMFRQLFAEGAFNVAFVPMLARQLEAGGRPQAEEFAKSVFSVLFWLALALSVVVMLFMPQVVGVLAPGFKDDPELFSLTVTLSQITFPYFMFITMTSFVGGVLNTLKRFVAFAAAPILLNISFVLCLLFLTNFTPTAVIAAAIAVPLGGLAQITLMLIAVHRAGFKVRLSLPHGHGELKTLGKRMIPTLIGVGAQQLTTLVSMMLASLLPAASISYLFYADRLNQLPLGLIGIALATVLLPTLSRSLKQGHNDYSQKLLVQGLGIALALGLAAACGLMMLSGEIMTVLFQRGAFSGNDAIQSGMALAAYSAGLPAYVLVKLTNTAFYAHENTKTPVQTALVSLVVGLVMMTVLMGPFGHTGLAAATSVAAWVNLLLQFYLLRRMNILQPMSAFTFTRYALKATFMVGLMACFIEVIKLYAPLLGDFAVVDNTSTTQSALWLAGTIMSAGGLWAACGYLLGMHRLIFAFALEPKKQA